MEQTLSRIHISYIPEVGDTIEEDSFVPGGGEVVTATVHSGADAKLNIGRIHISYLRLVKRLLLVVVKL